MTHLYTHIYDMTHVKVIKAVMCVSIASVLCYDMYAMRLQNFSLCILAFLAPTTIRLYWLAYKEHNA